MTTALPIVDIPNGCFNGALAKVLPADEPGTDIRRPPGPMPNPGVRR